MKQALLLLTVVLSFNVNAQEYTGSSFNEVMDVISSSQAPVSSEKEQNELNVYLNHQLPQYPVNMLSIFSPFKDQLSKDAVRTMNERFDYYDRLEKRLHSNGVCVSGTWNISEATIGFGGALKGGTKGLFVGRISVAMEETVNSEKRGFGFAGKVFPTMNPNEKVTTANFFTVDVLLGTKSQFLDTALTNEPELGLSFDSIPVLGLASKITKALEVGDKNPGFRPLTQLSTNSPKWIRLSPMVGTTRSKAADFRNEVLEALEMNKGKLFFNIDISNTTKDRKGKKGWERAGFIEINQADVSYGCDRRLHFAHPKLK